MAFNSRYYEILGLDYQASQQVIDHVYKNLQKAYHPDMHPQNRHFYTEKIQLINEAHATLGNPRSRAEYDSLLADHKRTRFSGNAGQEDRDQNGSESIEYCSGCGRRVESLVLTCPQCGTWISPEKSWDQEKRDNFEYYENSQSGARLIFVGVKIAKNGARLLGKSVIRKIATAAR